MLLILMCCCLSELDQDYQLEQIGRDCRCQLADPESPEGRMLLSEGRSWDSPGWAWPVWDQCDCYYCRSDADCDSEDEFDSEEEDMYDEM